MSKPMQYIVIAIVIILVLWLGWTWYASRGLETPPYQVTAQRDGFEIRQYDQYIVAKVRVDGDFDAAVNQGFRLLAGYIFGGNTAQQSIKMTAPATETAVDVSATEKEYEKIAMTAPVTEQVTEGQREITFMMPSQYTLETLPIPDDDRVTFAAVPPATYAALRFGGYATPARVERKKAELEQLVTDAGLQPVAPPVYAGYNDPWSFPLLRRNEILIEIE